MMPWYMSAMYTVPSGAVRMFTGRNSGSLLRMNSDSRYAFLSCVRPSFLTIFVRPDQTADRLGEQQIAFEIGGQSIAPHDVRPARRGEVIEQAIRNG